MATSDGATDFYAGSSETTEGRVFTVTGQDWDSIVTGIAADDWLSADERIVASRGTQPDRIGQRRSGNR